VSSEVQIVHDMLRFRFTDIVQKSEFVIRPWIWGAGDASDVSSEEPTVPSATHESCPPVVNQVFPVVSPSLIRLLVVVMKAIVKVKLCLTTGVLRVAFGLMAGQDLHCVFVHLLVHPPGLLVLTLCLLPMQTACKPGNPGHSL
jgi:hypothetical protein